MIMIKLYLSYSPSQISSAREVSVATQYSGTLMTLTDVEHIEIGCTHSYRLHALARTYRIPTKICEESKGGKRVHIINIYSIDLSVILPKCDSPHGSQQFD